ncbi:MAG: GAF domain-containing protein [Chloroflexaceae bacterium]|nr:GAF domain-containing protein [Chloroflexaceae bacterium]
MTSIDELRAENKWLRDRVEALEALHALSVQREEQSWYHHSVVVSLVKQQQQTSNLETFLPVLTKTTSEMLDVDRVGVWVYTEPTPGIRCSNLYERLTSTYTQGMEVYAADYPAYFHALETDQVIAAHDAFSDPATQEFAEYLHEYNIGAMLNVPIWRNGRTVGVLCLENSGGERYWTLDEQAVARLLADILTLAMETGDRHRMEAERLAFQQQVIEAQQAILRELSTPLIPFSDHILIMPLIGTIDSGRAQQVIETLLEGVATHHATHVILDITGVRVVDTQVAGALISAAQSVRLLGAHIILTGIAPMIAQTLVHLGVDLSSITTLGSLSNGINYAIRAQKHQSTYVRKFQL